MIPIEKNIIVTDVNGRTIGSTYPKRAKGLVKNGRAEYTDDHTIRLKFTRAPTVDKNTEDTKMSKVIDFIAREFKFDPNCGSNAGERVFMTTALGNAEVWEIGDWHWNWSQITCEKKLEKNMDYVLRFAMTGGHNDTDDAVSQVILCGVDGYDTPEEAWENRMSFALARSRYEPIVSKRDKTGLLRVFEIPFNTGEQETWRIFFAAQHAVARFFAAKEFAEYEKLEDLTYDEWWNERRKQLDKEWNRKYDHSNNNLADIIRSKIGLDVLKKLTGFEDLAELEELTGFSSGELFDEAEDDEDFDIPDKEKISGSNTEYTERQFAVLVKSCRDGSKVILNNITVHPDGSRELYDIGGSINGAIIKLENATITAKAFSMIVKKLGYGCIADMMNITVTKEGIDNMYRSDVKSDGTVIDLDEATLPQKALDTVYDKLGVGCSISTDNCTIE